MYQRDIFPYVCVLQWRSGSNLITNFVEHWDVLVTMKTCSISGSNDALMTSEDLYIIEG
jgi:hypothetical protein